MKKFRIVTNNSNKSVAVYYGDMDVLSVDPIGTYWVHADITSQRLVYAALRWYDRHLGFDDVRRLPHGCCGGAPKMW